MATNPSPAFTMIGSLRSTHPPSPAVAAAISLFGFHSGAALATVVGVLIEVPVMLSVVKIVNGSKRWYEKGQRRPGEAIARRP